MMPNIWSSNSFSFHFSKLSHHLVEVHWRLEGLRIEEGNKQDNGEEKFQQTCNLEPFSRWVGIQVIYYDKWTENSEPPKKRLVLAFSEHKNIYKNYIYFVVVLYDNNLGMKKLIF